MEIAIPCQIGLCVRRARKEQGLTQRELALRAGVSERLILSLELGDAPGIQLDKLMSVTQALGIRLFAEPSLQGADRPTREEGACEPDAPGAAGAGRDSVAGEHPSMLECYRSLYDELARATRERAVS